MNRGFAYSAACALAIVTSVSAQAVATGLNGAVRVAIDANAQLAKAKPLAGAEIRAQLVGNTISGHDKGQTYFEFIVPDGTIRGLEDDGFYAGAWRIDKDRICFHYDEDDGDGKGWDCDPVTLDSDKIYWSREIREGAKPGATLMVGNPRNL